ncbi:MAG: hypothetical protein NVV73_05390 [Cellvibrionaceae bacterium]|nr:hypothetical protein [Cellvibrionaceae bacterium]
MKRIMTLLMLAMLFGCNATTPQKQQKPFVPLSAEESADIDRVEANGRELYERDIRAAEASDLVLSRIYPADYPKFVGWVTHPNAQDYTVSFYEKDGENVTVIADVIYDQNQTPDVQIGPERAPSATEVSMLKARIAALEKGVSSCSQNFNTVVLPGRSEDKWDVFVLAATTHPTAVQVGGHSKVSVSKTTGEVTEVIPLSKSCLSLDKYPDGMPEGASIKMLTVSHIVSPHPVEIHPYLNMLHGIPFAVLTERGVWIVKEGNIEIMDTTKSK